MDIIKSHNIFKTLILSCDDFGYIFFISYYSYVW